MMRQIASKVKMLRDHGQAKKYYHDIEGYNGRLDAIQAGILNVKLRHLPAWNCQRRDHAAQYRRLFDSTNSGVTPPYEPFGSKPVYHLYVIRVEKREALVEHLNSVGIGTGIHYPIPLHMQKAYGALNYARGELPVSEKVAAEIVSLPMFPRLTPEQQARVVNSLLRFTKCESVTPAELVAGQ